jgi:hypothetical protein
MDTLPPEGSRSPPIIFIKVDLPQPLAPIKPYLLPLPNLAETFSKRGFAPNWIVMFAVVSKVNIPLLKIKSMFHSAFYSRWKISAHIIAQYKRKRRI